VHMFALSTPARVWCNVQAIQVLSIAALAHVIVTLLAYGNFACSVCTRQRGL